MKSGGSLDFSTSAAALIRDYPFVLSEEPSIVQEKGIEEFSQLRMDEILERAEDVFHSRINITPQLGRLLSEPPREVEDEFILTYPLYRYSGFRRACEVGYNRATETNNPGPAQRAFTRLVQIIKGLYPERSQIFITRLLRPTEPSFYIRLHDDYVNVFGDELGHIEGDLEKLDRLINLMRSGTEYYLSFLELTDTYCYGDIRMSASEVLKQTYRPLLIGSDSGEVSKMTEVEITSQLTGRERNDFRYALAELRKSMDFQNNIEPMRFRNPSFRRYSEYGIRLLIRVARVVNQISQIGRASCRERV